MPLVLKIRGGVGKWPLRRILYKYVPRELIERPKQGFDIPLAVATWSPTGLGGRPTGRATPK